MWYGGDYRAAWYDRQGNRLNMDEAAAILADQEGRRIGLDRVGPYVISTVFLVLDHGWRGTPELYETMVFSADEWDRAGGGLTDYDERRYATEAEAVQGHADMVTLVRATTTEADKGTEGLPE